MGRFSTIFAALAMTFVAGAAAQAQSRDETLADIRQEMTVLYVEVQRLKRELSTTGGVNTNVAGNSVRERVDVIEQELQRLTSKTEELESRINRIVTDGTNRIGDLEFRLVELEGGDIGALGETTTLGGDTGSDNANQTIIPATGQPTGSELAVGEQIDFDLAMNALNQGENQVALGLFQMFNQTYTRSPLTGPAHYYRGEALDNMGQTADAARAFLESYSGSPASAVAAKALYRLGTSLSKLGQMNEACVTLSQVQVLYPQSDAVAQAQSSIRSLGCP